MIYVIVATYKQNCSEGLPRLLDSLKSQVDKDFKVIVVHDGPDIDGTKDLVASCEYVYLETEKRENVWGHNCREYGLNYVLSLINTNNLPYKESYIYFTNGDNEKYTNCISVFNTLSKDRSEVLLAQIKHSYFDYGVLDVQFQEARCDFMNMCLRSDIMKELKFPYRSFAADAHLIRDINKKFPNRIVHKSDEIIGLHH